MIPVYVGEADADFTPCASYVKLNFSAGESITSIKQRITNKLTNTGNEWALVLLDRIEGTGPFKPDAGTFVFAWDETCTPN
jgi:hypothetical protein